MKKTAKFFIEGKFGLLRGSQYLIDLVLQYLFLFSIMRNFYTQQLELINKINKINKIKVDSNSFIIHYFNSILKFNTNGSFVCKIGKEGRGPGEFVVAHEIDIDEKTHNIYLVDGWIRKFYVYSENGEFLKTFKSPLNAIKFRLTSDGILCFSTNYIANVDTSFVLIDREGHIIKSFPNKYPWHYKVQHGTAGFEENLFYKFNNKIFKKKFIVILFLCLKMDLFYLI